MSATYAQFLSDPLSEHLWIAEVSYYDTVGLTTGTLYYSTGKYGTAAGDTLVSQLFEPRLLNGYNFTATAPSIGAFGGLLPAREGGSIILAQSLGDLDELRLYSFDGRRVVIRHGGTSPQFGTVAYDDFAVVFDGEGDGQALIGIDTVTLKLRNKDARFEFPIQDRHYTGGRYWMYFDGVNDRISGAHSGDAANAGLNFTSGNFSIEFFIYIESLPGAAKHILTRGVINASGWTVRLTTGGAITLVTSQAGASQTTTSNALTLNKRTHVAIVRSGAAVSIYLDGVLEVAASGTHVNPTAVAATFYVGQNDSGAAFFNGFLDELRIWNDAKTIDGINSKKDRQLTSSEVLSATLKLYYKFDDGTGQTVTDSSTAAVNGDITTNLGTWRPSLQGNEDLTGAVLPDVWGQREGYAPVLVDEPRMIYQVHSGSVYEMSAIYVGGAAIGLDTLGTSGGVYTSMSGFLAHVTTAGKYARLITAYGSWFKLGSQPNKPVTMKVKGDYTGGVYVSTIGAIVRRIICTRGPQPLTDPTDLDTDSFDLLETDAPYTVGDGYADDMSIAEVVGFLLASAGVVGWFRRADSTFTVKVFDTAALLAKYSEVEAATFTEKNIEEDTLEAVDVGPPSWGVDVRYRRNDVVHSTTDIVASIIGDTTDDTNFWRFLMNEWRTVRPRNSSTRTTYKGATVLVVDSAIQLWSDAETEAARLLDLYDQQGQCFRAFFDRSAAQIDRMDKVVLHFQDADAHGAMQSRLGTGADTVFVVLAVEDDVENGGTWLTLYREAIS